MGNGRFIALFCYTNIFFISSNFMQETERLTRVDLIQFSPQSCNCRRVRFNALKILYLICETYQANYD